MLIKVKVFPNSKKEELIKEGKEIKIKVKEKAIQNKANQAARKMLSEHLKKPVNQIRIIKGFKQRSKIFKINE